LFLSQATYCLLPLPPFFMAGFLRRGLTVFRTP
jgi:hypothetical protein